MAGDLVQLIAHQFEFGARRLGGIGHLFGVRLIFGLFHTRVELRL